MKISHHGVPGQCPEMSENIHQQQYRTQTDHAADDECIPTPPSLDHSKEVVNSRHGTYPP